MGVRESSPGKGKSTVYTTTVYQRLDALENEVGAGGSTLTGKADKSYVDGLAGDLSQLTTTDKSNLVNAVNENVSALANIVTNVKQFGAIGDGITDDTAAINMAIQSLPIDTGGTVLIPGKHLIKGSGTELILIDRPVIFKGVGYHSKLIVDSTVPTTTDVIHISPNVNNSVWKMLYGLHDFEIVPKSGTPARHAVHVDVTASGQWLSHFNMSGVIISQELNGYGFKLTNPNNQDGFFCSTIAENYISGGIYLNNVGDSVNILRNKINSTKNIGIESSSVASARMLVIEGNNITGNGSIKIHSGGQIKIRYNQMEQTFTYTGSDGAMIVIGTDSFVYNAEIKGNNLNTHNTNIASAIKLDQALYTLVDDNYCFIGTGNILVMTANSQQNKIGSNNVLENSTNTGLLRFRDYITDSGVGNAGVEKLITYQNGWVDYDSTNEGAGYVIKDMNGFVQLCISAKSGTFAHGTIIGTIPSGFTPKSSLYFTAGNSAADIRVLITPGGNIQLLGTDATNTFLDLSHIRYRAS